MPQPIPRRHGATYYRNGPEMGQRATRSSTVSTQVTKPTQAQRASSRQEPDAPRAESRLASRLFIAALAVAMLPIAVAAVRALVRHWIPLSDDAFFVVRAHDV